MNRTNKKTSRDAPEADAPAADAPEADAPAADAPAADAPAADAPAADAPASETAKPVQGPAVVGKVTVANVFGKIIVAKLPPVGESVEICKMVGYASGMKEGVTQYGQWRALTGEFAATNLATGEIFIGKTGIIPGPMGEALIDAVIDKLKDDAAAKVAFAVIVSVKRSAKNPDEKYEYVVRPVMDAKISSPALTLLGM